ncbi:MAG: hypothetical protein ACTIBZ_05710 [Corynebacterium variabile]|uniref:hypothetical protein n=1 Tax=Corynebacterium variabile TaxID=1727 RepID=UPI002647F03F|nr:hypothetical protein [Corynebacterium variabile]MDN6812854.1 hypothetical protein [Corynebacterium variabile]MDN6843797.1 hypothetical protein [Corynebacterium variabile]
MSSPRESCMGVDLTVTPWLYPGRWPTRSGTLTSEGWFPGDLALAEVGLDGGRRPVVAVGSNASPGVMQIKLRQHGVSETVPFVRACVPDVGTAFTAHVSPRGYIAAAPVRRAGAEASMWVSFLDDDQLAVIDETEVPNYTREHVPDPVTLFTGEVLHGYDVYRSAWGLIPELPFARRQHAVLTHLRSRCVVPSLPEGDAETVVRAMWIDRDLADRVSGELHALAVVDGY